MLRPLNSQIEQAILSPVFENKSFELEFENKPWIFKVSIQKKEEILRSPYFIRL